jgi:hypothetical protein
VGTLRRQGAPELRWLKGRARFEDGAIVLDPASTTEYHPFADAVTDFPYELSAIAEPRDAVDFARRFGLLHHGPGDEELREPWTEWEAAALQIRGIMRLGVHLGEAIRGDEEALSSVRVHAERWADQFQAPASNDDEVFAQVSIVLAGMVNAGLDDVGFGVEAEVGKKLPDGSIGRPSRFAFSPRSPDLLGLIYYAVGLAMVAGVPGRSCAGCGRIFPVRDPRQRYHDNLCAQRTRYRRWAEKNRSEP